MKHDLPSLDLLCIENKLTRSMEFEDIIKDISDKKNRKRTFIESVQITCMLNVEFWFKNIFVFLKSCILVCIKFSNFFHFFVFSHPFVAPKMP
jgi:hypothetical protein